MGSSVANGEGAERDSAGVLKGYAYMLDRLLSKRYASGLSTNPFYLSNISINGNSSVNLLDRFQDLESESGCWVIYGISLGNEGIHGAINQDSIYHQFRRNMLELIERARKNGKQPVVMNNYTRLDFDESDYEAIKKMNDEIAFWDVPSVNLLGAIDDGTGRWAEETRIATDIYHPNTVGHEEFFHAIVPSMMDAMAAGKPLEMDRIADVRSTLPSFTTIDFVPDDEVHSFTLAFSVEEPQNGLLTEIKIAGDPDQSAKIISNDGKIIAMIQDGCILEVNAEKGLNEIVLSQNFARKYITLTVNGHTAAKEDIQPIIPVSISVGNPEAERGLTLGEIMFYRSSMHASSPFTENEKLNKSSLELYIPMNEKMENKAMSTVEATLNCHNNRD